MASKYRAALKGGSSGMMRSLNQPEAQQERALGFTTAGWAGNAQLETRHGAARLANLNCHDDPPLYMM